MRTKKRKKLILKRETKQYKKQIDLKTTKKTFISLLT